MRLHAPIRTHLNALAPAVWLIFLLSPVAWAVPELPAGVTQSDWRSMAAQIEAHQHQAVASEHGFQAKNPGQQWRTDFDAEGFLVTPQTSDWTWGLTLERYGVVGARQTPSGPPRIEARGKRVEYVWDDTLTEWMVNDSRGLEHGFTLNKRPQGDGEGLRFTLAVRGGLHPQALADGSGASFHDARGTAVMNYTGLKVFDATGRDLPARFTQQHGALHLAVDDRGAAYPVTIDPVAQQAYLKASNTGRDDLFGSSVAISGDTVVVGARWEASNATGVDGNQADNSAARSGAAYVFIRSAGLWSQQAYLKASNTGAGDWFGASVAVDGDTVVVGARFEDSHATGVDGNQADNSAIESGAAYVFTRTSGVWSQQAYLKAANTEEFDEFGVSVGISSETVVVGAFLEDSHATGVDGNQADNSVRNSGAAYVFTRTSGVWSQHAYLKASNTEAHDLFGGSVAISEDTVVVGASAEDSHATGVNGNQADNSSHDSGAAYVFTRTSGVWSQQAYLKASNTGAGGQFSELFGRSAAISGDTVVVGAPFEDSIASGAVDSGAAYVFVRSTGLWSQQAYLKASNIGAGDQFGDSVAISGDTLVVGAWLEDSHATGVDGNQADDSTQHAGAAYVFVRGAGVWSQQAYLKASNTGTGDLFGGSVAVSGDTVVVGARWEDSNATGVDGNQADDSVRDSGAVYIFTLLPEINPLGSAAPIPMLSEWGRLLLSGLLALLAIGTWRRRALSKTARP